MGDPALRSIAATLERLERTLNPPPEPRYRNPHDRDSAYDGHGKIPRRLDLALIVRSVPGMAERFRRVPGRAVVESGSDGDGPYALVECPCGQKPVVRAPLRQCSGCQRFYMLPRATAWVFYGDMEPPPLPPDAVPDVLPAVD